MFKAKSRRRRPRKQKEQQRPNSGAGYSDIIKENAAFEKYYKAQGIVPEEQWDAFMATLRENLPVSFRITGSKSQAQALLKILETEYFSQLVPVTEDGETVESPTCLSWYPDRLAWQLSVSRKCVRKSESFTKLHSFLVYETNCGNISRQETVSMIPPLLLDVQPHHYVLDMCAAPGSKTAQLIEMLHTDDVVPEGMVVANDVDNRRCYMLVHQSKRLRSPSFVITNHDASSMPNVRKTQANGTLSNLKYDRILCDVPCSGDGTLRKNYDVWMKWNPANGNNLHGIQARIAKRGLELLTVGGRMVYSTCSFNPVEDEAVIHNVLVQCEGSVELVDVGSSLPGLHMTKGLSSWKVMSRDMAEHTLPENVPEKFQTQIRANMFPPKPEDAEKFHLDRCIRILPHQQNTGGFFVAVLTKVKLLPGEKPTVSVKAEADSVGKVEGVAADAVSSSSGTRNGSSPPRKRQRLPGYREDPFIFFKDDEVVWAAIRDYYGIKPSFNSKCLLTRCETGKKRNIYFVCKAVRDLVMHNADRIKVINTGVKIFCRNDNKGATCGFRLTQEGIDTIIPFLTNRCVTINKSDLVVLLTNEYPFNTKMSPETRNQLQALDSGCVALIFNFENEGLEPLPIILCGWKGATSTRAYVPKSDRVHYLRLCGVDTSKYDRGRYKSSKGSAAGADNADSGAEETVGSTVGDEDEADAPDDDGGALDEEPEELEDSKMVEEEGGVVDSTTNLNTS